MSLNSKWDKMEREYTRRTALREILKGTVSRKDLGITERQ